MGIGASLYMYVVVVQKFTFAISSPDEFLYERCAYRNFSFAFVHHYQALLSPLILRCRNIFSQHVTRLSSHGR